MLNPNRSCQTCRWWYTLRGQWYCQFAPCSGCYWNPEHPKWEEAQREDQRMWEFYHEEEATNE